MDDNETPDVISARGPVALEAYLEASSQDGTKPVYRTRLMLVGQERVGKTSLMKNLSGQKISATESITDGVDASNFCAIPVDSTKPWKRQQGDRKSSESTSDNIRERILKLLENTEEHDEKERFTTKETDERQGVPEFQIWDFAGQDIYYTTHQVFLSNRAIYLLVFDLRLDLDKPVKVQVHLEDKVHSRFHDLTGLGFLDFWMQSIYAYATTNQTSVNDDEDRPQLSPPIFIVGTHRDSHDISTDAEERKTKIYEKFRSINELIAGKPYEQHVVSNYYAIENSCDNQSDSDLLNLRQHIVTVASQEPYMGELIPKRWLDFEKFVAAAIKKGQHYMNLEEVKELSQGLGINSDQVISTMLDFYHDLGTIIYFGCEDTSNTHLQDMVILDPQWLIDIFRRIITVMPHSKQWATLRNKWRRLKEEGILEDHLIDHMWHDLLPQKPALLALMEMFDLLCPRLDFQEPHDSLTYYVPACLRPHGSTDKTQKILAADGKIVTFYIDFQGFLPDGLFHRLLVHAARWSQQSSGEEPKLFFRYGSFCLDDEHNFVLQMISTSPISIKVTLSKVQVMTPGAVDNNSNIESQPCPKACSMVRIFLSNTLKELTGTWIRGIKYEFAAPCPCNDLSDKSQQEEVSRPFHLLCLEECLVPNKARIKCKENNMWVETEVFKTWFHTEEELLEPVDDAKKVSRTISDVELLELAGEVGVDWKKLGIYLGLRASHIASLNTDYPMTEDKAFHMLVKWRKTLTKIADARMLIGKALLKCGLVGLAESYDSLEGAISNI